jgi:hypothetical protein
MWDQLNIQSLVDPNAAIFNLGRDVLGSDQPLIPTCQDQLFTYPNAAIFNFGRNVRVFDPPLIPTCQRRFFRYLSLYNGDEYIKGLTIYQTNNNIIGLEAHFTQTSQLSGCRIGSAIYFPLAPNERIAYAWLRVIDFNSPLAWAPPALVVSS